MSKPMMPADIRLKIDAVDDRMMEQAGQIYGPRGAFKWAPAAGTSGRSGRIAGGSWGDQLVADTDSIKTKR